MLSDEPAMAVGVCHSRKDFPGRRHCLRDIGFSQTGQNGKRISSLAECKRLANWPFDYLANSPACRKVSICRSHQRDLPATGRDAGAANGIWIPPTGALDATKQFSYSS